MPKKISDLSEKPVLGEVDSFVLSDTVAGVDQRVTVFELRNNISAELESIAALREFPGRKDGQVVNLLSWHPGLNQGGGIFVWDNSSTSTDDGGGIIKPHAIDGQDPGRWLRRVDDSVTAKMFGAFADDVADDTASINSAADFCRDKNITLDLGVKNKYRITGVLYFTNLTVRGSQNELHCDVSGGLFNAVQCLAGGEQAVTALSGALDANVNYFIVESAQEFKAGHIVQLLSDKDWYYRTGQGWKKGELHVIKSVNGNIVEVENTIQDSYSDSETVTVTVYDPIRVDLSGFRVIYPKNTFPAVGIEVHNAVDSVIAAGVVGSSHKGIQIDRSYRVEVKGKALIKGANRDGWGYGVHVRGCSYVDVHGIDFENCRASVDFSGNKIGSGETPPSRWCRQYECNVNGAGKNQDGVDDFATRGGGSHPPAEYCDFFDNYIENVDNGFHFRGKGHKAWNNRFRNVKDQYFRISFGSGFTAHGNESIDSQSDGKDPYSDAENEMVTDRGFEFGASYLLPGVGEQGTTKIYDNHLQCNEFIYAPYAFDGLMLHGNRVILGSKNHDMKKIVRFLNCRDDDSPEILNSVISNNNIMVLGGKYEQLHPAFIINESTKWSAFEEKNRLGKSTGLSFDGIDDYARLNADINMEQFMPKRGPVSIYANGVFKEDSTLNYIIWCRQNSNNEFGFRFRNDDRGEFYLLSGGTHISRHISTGTVDKHVHKKISVCSVNPRNRTGMLYINGKPQGYDFINSDDSENDFSVSGRFHLASRNIGEFPGKIDLFALMYFNCELSREDVINLPVVDEKYIGASNENIASSATELTVGKVVYLVVDETESITINGQLYDNGSSGIDATKGVQIDINQSAITNNLTTSSYLCYAGLLFDLPPENIGLTQWRTQSGLYFDYGDNENQNLIPKSINVPDKLRYKHRFIATTNSVAIPAIKKGYRIDSIVIEETSGNSPSQFRIGTTETGSEIMEVRDIDANELLEVDVQKRVFDTDTKIYVNATTWGGAELNIDFNISRY